MVLVGQLPPESATSTAVRNSATEDELANRRGDATKAPWSSTDQLLASVIDAVNNLTWVYAQSQQKGKLARPAPVPRPGSGRSSGRRQLTIQEIKEIDPRLRGLPDDVAWERYKGMTGRD